MKQSGIILTIIIIGVGIGAAALFSMTGSGNFILDTTYPPVPDHLAVYKTREVGMTPENATRLALSMGIRGDIRDIYSGLIEITDNSRNPPESIEIFKNSGAFRYSIHGKLSPAISSQPPLPSHKEAKWIADRYLEERNLLSDDFRFEEVKDGERQEEWRAGESEPIESYILNIQVRYRRYINGIPATGGITVTVGENGEVVGLFYKSRAIDEEPICNARIITPEEAYKTLIDGNVLLKPITGPVRITNVSLQYYLKGETQEQQFVLPIYVFYGEEIFHDSSPVVIYVAAVDPQELEITLLDPAAYSK